MLLTSMFAKQMYYARTDMLLTCLIVMQFWAIVRWEDQTTGSRFQVPGSRLTESDLANLNTKHSASLSQRLGLAVLVCGCARQTDQRQADLSTTSRARGAIAQRAVLSRTLCALGRVVGSAAGPPPSITGGAACATRIEGWNLYATKW